MLPPLFLHRRDWGNTGCDLSASPWLLVTHSVIHSCKENVNMNVLSKYSALLLLWNAFPGPSGQEPLMNPAPYVVEGGAGGTLIHKQSHQRYRPKSQDIVSQQEGRWEENENKIRERGERGRVMLKSFRGRTNRKKKQRGELQNTKT